jgi:hypothetical protein
MVVPSNSRSKHTYLMGQCQKAIMNQYGIFKPCPKGFCYAPLCPVICLVIKVASLFCHVHAQFSTFIRFIAANKAALFHFVFYHFVCRFGVCPCIPPSLIGKAHGFPASV